MSLFSDGIGLSPSFLVQGYPWSAVGNDGRGTVVDVGGSRGFQCVAIAQNFPDLHFVVQDLPDMIDGAKYTLPANVESRIRFMNHDFFTEQPVSADIYLFRIIFHNWSDANVVKILKATVPAMQSGSRIVVNDYLIPEPGVLPPTKEREVRYVFIVPSMATCSRLPNVLFPHLCPTADITQSDGHDHAQPVQFPRAREGRLAEYIPASRYPLHKRQGLGPRRRNTCYRRGNFESMISLVTDTLATTMVTAEAPAGLRHFPPPQ